MVWEGARSVVNRTAERVAKLAPAGKWIQHWAAARLPREACRVLFVCKGNICRSAYAEGAARALLGNSSGWGFASAGLQATPGAPPPEIAVRIAWERGVDLREHHARPMSAFDPGAVELVLVMEPVQMVDGGLAPFRGRCRVLPLGAIIGTPLIADPFGQSEAVFRVCFAQIDSAIRELANGTGMER